MGDKNQYLYNLSTAICKNFYNKNKIVCRLSGYDLSDLKQEARIYIWKIIEKYPDLDQESLKKLACKATIWRLRAFKKFFMKPKLKLLSPKENIIDKEFNEEDSEIIYSLSQISEYLDAEEHNKKNMGNLKNKKNKIPFIEPNKYSYTLILEDIKKMCSEREYYVLEQILLYRRKFNELAKEMKITKQGVKFIYDNILKQIRHKLEKEK